jgi:hypothetical protein
MVTHPATRKVLLQIDKLPSLDYTTRQSKYTSGFEQQRRFLSTPQHHSHTSRLVHRYKDAFDQEVRYVIRYSLITSGFKPVARSPASPSTLDHASILVLTYVQRPQRWTGTRSLHHRPKAEKWRPDPNSIARPGGLKDPRFNKDPYAEEKKAAMKREMRLHGYHSPLGSTVISINGATASRPAVGSWPVQAACSSGMPTPPLTSPPVSINENSIKPVAEVSTPTIALTTPKSPPAYDPMRKVTQATMEDLPIMTMGSAKVSKFVRAASPEKSSLPAWAGPLEKALAEDTLKTPLVPGSAASTTISIPTHMRRQLSDGDSRPLAAARYQPLSLDAHFEQACDTTRRVSDPISAQPHLNGVSSRGAGSVRPHLTMILLSSV